MIDPDEETVPRQRQLSAGVTNGRAARALVAAVQEKFGHWQAEAVKLEVMVRRVKASGRRDPRVGEAVRTLSATIYRQTEMLEDEAAKVPAAIGEHSRVSDVLKALKLLAARLDSMLGALGETHQR